MDTSSSYACTYVKGHYRNGKYVSGYYRGCGGNSYSTTTPSDSQSTVTNRAANISYTSYSSRLINLYKGTQFAGQTDKNILNFVQGYYRKDGTYIRPHYRTHRNSFVTDNLSYQGLSTLLPLDKTFNFSQDTKLSTVERYIYSIVGHQSLNNSQWDSLKNYAKVLHSSEGNSQTNALEVGSQFYKGLGYDSSISKVLSRFDLSNNIDHEQYLHHILVQLGLKGLTDTQNQELTKYQRALLNSSSDIVRTGESFYTSLGLDETAARIQIEMDRLQTVEHWKASEISEKLFYELKQVQSYDSSKFRSLGYQERLIVLELPNIRAYYELPLSEQKRILMQYINYSYQPSGDIHNLSLYLINQGRTYTYLSTSRYLTRNEFQLTEFTSSPDGTVSTHKLEKLKQEATVLSLWDSLNLVKRINYQDKNNFGLKSSYDTALIFSINRLEDFSAFNQLPLEDKRRIVSHAVYKLRLSSHDVYNGFVFVTYNNRCIVDAKLSISTLSDGGTGAFKRFNYDPTGSLKIIAN